MRGILSLAVLLIATTLNAQSYRCPNCGKIHQRQSVAVSVQTGDALDLANQQRADRGLGPLRRDPTLTQGAIAKVRRAASMRRRGHIGGSMYGANKEGVGWSTSKRAAACYLYTAPAGTAAGCGMAQDSRGQWYTCLLIRHSGYLPSGQARSRLRLFRR